MNRQETISPWQMATLFLSFLTGSAVVNIPAPLVGAAKNGAWISLLLAGSVGMLLLFCILYLHKQYPGLTFIDYSRKAIGNGLTVFFSIPFLMALFLMLTNIVIDIGGFMTSTMMERTPHVVFHGLILMTAAITVREGIEVMARMFTFLLYVMTAFVTIVLFLAFNNYHPEYLLPVLPDGFRPVLHGTYLSLGFPYLELVVFAMILPFCRKEKGNLLSKLMVSALVVNIISLLTVTICSIMVLGPLTGMRKYSVFAVARMVDVAEIIRRIESVIGMSLIAGSYMKATIVLFVITMTLSQLLKLQDDRILVYPIALVGLLMSVTMYKTPVEFNDMVLIVWPLFIFIVWIVPLILITLVTVFKGKKGKSGPAAEKKINAQ